MKRIKDIACISRPSANIRIKPAIMLFERYCFPEHPKVYHSNIHFLNCHFDDFIGESRNAHPPFYPLPTSRGSKKREADLQLPLKNLLIFQCLRLT